MTTTEQVAHDLVVGVQKLLDEIERLQMLVQRQYGKLYADCESCRHCVENNARCDVSEEIISASCPMWEAK